jgi:oligoendopeptidase F
MDGDSTDVRSRLAGHPLANVRPVSPAEHAPRWDLTPIFHSLDDRAFTDAIEGIFASVDRLVALYDGLGIRGVGPREPTDVDISALERALEATNALQTELRPLSAYLNGLVTTDSREERAASLMVELQTRTAVLGPMSKRLGAWLEALGADRLTSTSDVAASHAFALGKAADDARYQMGEAEESLAAELAPAGALAWQRLHGDVSSQLMVEIATDDGAPERVPMAMARGLATHPDPVRRRRAYEGELAAWATVAVPLAAALNGAKGAHAVLNRRRGFSDDLEPALRFNNVDRATLDAMTGAVVASLPMFRGYLRTKAALLGHDDGLPWWDLFAPARSTGHGPPSWSRRPSPAFRRNSLRSQHARSRSRGSTPRSATASAAARTACRSAVTSVVS